MPRRGRRPIDLDIQLEIRRLTLEGKTPREITAALELDQRFADRAPVKKTVERYVQKSTIVDASAPWSWTEAPRDQAALILPVLGAVLERTRGRVGSFTKEQAIWVERVRGATLDLGPWYVWRVAQAYQLAVQRGGDADRESLDALLAFAPWRSFEAAARFREWAWRVHPGWFTRERFVIAPAGMPFSANDAKPLGNVAGLSIADDIEVDFRMRALGLDDRGEPRARISIKVGASKEEEESNEPPRQP